MNKRACKRYSWLVVWLCVAVLLAACGEVSATENTDQSGETYSEPDTPIPDEPEQEASAPEETEGTPEEIVPVIATYEYYIDELDVTLEIPENLYVYQIDGIYLDWNENLTKYDFADWIIVTDKEYTPNYLESSLILDIHEEAKHIVFGIELPLPSEQLFPLCRLNTCYFTGTDRVINGEYLRILNPVWEASDVGVYSYREDSLCTDSEIKKQISEWETVIKDSTQPVCGTDIMTSLMLRPYSVGEDPYRYTMVNEVWWETYIDAVTKLEAAQDFSPYDEDTIQQLTEMAKNRIDNFANGVFVEEGRGEIVSIYADKSRDMHLRAYFYADRVTQLTAEGKDTSQISAEDFVVIRQEWSDGQHSCYVFYREDDTKEFEIVYDGGHDYMRDLRPSYQYLTQRMGLGKEQRLQVDLEYVLTQGVGSYYVSAKDFGEGRYIGKDGDTYLIVSDYGRRYSGQVVLTWQQKELLDAGLTLTVTYDGKVLDEISAYLVEESVYGEEKPIRMVWYKGNNLGKVMCVQSPEHDALVRRVAGIELSEPPYNGVGFYLIPSESIPKAFYGFRMDEGNVRLELSGDIPVEMGNGEVMTVAEFYENVEIIGLGLRFLVYEEDGEIVKLCAQTTP